MAPPPPAPRTDIHPPGRDAPVFPSRTNQQHVQRMIRSVANDVLDLDGETIRRLMPILDEARKELRRGLREWINNVPEGELRYTAQHHRRALASVQGAIDAITEVEPELAGLLTSAGDAAGYLAADHVRFELARMASVFGGPASMVLSPTQIDTAALVASGRKELIPRYETSAWRYVNNVRDDIRRQFGVGLARGETFHQLTERLRKLGGPRGTVALRGIAGQPGAIVENIAEGLFSRYRHWAERLVRTEVMNTYNAQHEKALDEVEDDIDEEEDGPLMKQWDASLDQRICPTCRSLHHVAVKKDEAFPNGAQRPPAHPNCRCVLVPYLERWGGAKDYVAPPGKPRPPPAPKAPKVPRTAKPPATAPASETRRAGRRQEEQARREAAQLARKRDRQEAAQQRQAAPTPVRVPTTRTPAPAPPPGAQPVPRQIAPRTAPIAPAAREAQRRERQAERERQRALEAERQRRNEQRRKREAARRKREEELARLRQMPVDELTAKVVQRKPQRAGESAAAWGKRITREVAKIKGVTPEFLAKERARRRAKIQERARQRAAEKRAAEQRERRNRRRREQRAAARAAREAAAPKAKAKPDTVLAGEEAIQKEYKRLERKYGYSIRKEDRTAVEFHLQQARIPREEFFRTFRPPPGFKSHMGSVSGSDTYIHFNASIRDGDRQAAQLTRSMMKGRDGKWVVKHDYLVFDKAYQATGAGNWMIANMYKGYERLNVAKVKVTAAWVGRYNWVKVGFRMDDVSIQRTAPIVRHTLQRAQAKGLLTARQVDKYHKVYLDDPTKFARLEGLPKLDYSYDGKTQHDPVNKAALMDSTMPMWDGEIKLGTPRWRDSRRILDAKAARYDKDRE